MHKTSAWFDDAALEAAAQRYRGFEVQPLGYATVRDFCDGYDNLRPLATANGDLKDAQRPWIFKALMSKVPPGGRVLEIGAGEPWVGDLLQRLGYQVTVVDPYDGSGNGPQEYEHFRRQCPKIRFVRAQFTDATRELEPGSFDCIYSISVLEHVPDEALPAVFAGIRKFLKPGSVTLHAVDHVHKGNGDKAHRAKLGIMMRGFALSEAELDQMLERMGDDTETYYLSAEAHNRWRGPIPYDQFPMRVCVSVQICVSGAREA
ncbi:MAG TPA: class I SAM-dependent methyltransferase [Myxococcales bacterium]|nr:class I SAM-dependent methyltransferase [Myxococcales bacterium]